MLTIALVQKDSYANEDERTSKAVTVIKEYLSGADLESGQDVVIRDADYFPRRPPCYASEVNTPGQGGGGGSNGGASTKLTASPPQEKEMDGYHSQLYSVVSDGHPSTLSQMMQIRVMTTVGANADLAEVQRVFWLPPDNNAKNSSLWTPDLAIYNVADIPAPVVTRMLS